MYQGKLERLHYNLARGWILFWKTVLAFTVHLNWLWFPFQNKIITHTETFTLRSPLWPHSFLLVISFENHSCNWSFSNSCLSCLHLKTWSNTAQPGPSLAVTLSPAPVSFLKVGEHFGAPLVCVLSCSSHIQLFETPWDSPSKNTRVGCHALLQGTSRPRHCTHFSCVSCTAGGFFTTEPPGKPLEPLKSLYFAPRPACIHPLGQFLVNFASFCFLFVSP